MKTLIATNNATKFELMCHVLRNAGIAGEFVRPSNLGINKDVEETGSLENRARQKAQALHDMLLGDPRGADITLYVGVDDGIRIEQEDTTYAESYEATDRILAGNGVKPGDDITIMRAFAFITNTGHSTACTTRVPLYFLGNPHNIKRAEGVYPLASVLAYHGTDMPAGDLDANGDAVMTSKFSANTIRQTLAKIDL